LEEVTEETEITTTKGMKDLIEEIEKIEVKEDIDKIEEMMEEDSKEEDKKEMIEKIENNLKDKIETEGIIDIHKMIEEEVTAIITDTRIDQDRLKTMKEGIVRIKTKELKMITNIIEDKEKQEEQNMLATSITKITLTETEMRTTENKIEDKEIQEKTDTQVMKIDWHKIN
jgi:hypothetical protein